MNLISDDEVWKMARRMEEGIYEYSISKVFFFLKKQAFEIS